MQLKKGSFLHLTLLIVSITLPRCRSSPVVPTFSPPTLLPTTALAIAFQPTETPFPPPTNTQLRPLPTTTLATALQPTELSFPLPTNAQLEKPCPFPTESISAKADILNACNLVTIDEVAALFPNPPVPINFTVDEGEKSGCACIFYDVDMELTIVITLDPKSKSELSDHVENLRKWPGVIQFPASEADIYLAGGLADESKVQYGFAAVIFKGDLGVEIIGTGKSYQYDAVRETLFLKAITGRLPLVRSVTADRNNECTLVTMDEVAALFPNPPVPTSELRDDNGHSVSICNFSDSDMSLVITSSSAPELIYDYAGIVQNMKQYPTFTQVSASEAYIYLAEEPNDQNQVGDAFAAVIYKNGIVVLIIGNGKAFQYDAERAIILLTAIAERLP